MINKTNDKLNDGKTVYIVCNSSTEVYPANILRVYSTLDSAYKFLGKYVTELNRSTYTGYLTIAAKKIGSSDDIKILGMDIENE